MSENGVSWFRAGRSVFLRVVWSPRITCQSWLIDDEFNRFFREHCWGDSNDRYPKAARLLELKINLSILVMNCHWCKGWAFHLCFHHIKIGVCQLNPHNRKWSMLGLQIQLFNFHPWVTCTSHHFIQQISFEIPSKLQDEAPVGSAGLGAALAALATAKRWHQASAALESFSASESCFPRRSRWFQNSMIFQMLLKKILLLFIYLFIDLFIHWFIYLFINLFNYLFFYFLYITYIMCVFPLCIFVCMCIWTYIRTHDMCIFMSAWPRVWSIYCWKGLVWWLAILEDPMGYQSPGAPTNLPSKSLDENRVVFLCLTLLILTRSYHPLTGHTYYTSQTGETTNQFMAKNIPHKPVTGKDELSTSFCVVFNGANHHV